MIKPLLVGTGMITAIVLLSGGSILYIRFHNGEVASIPSNGYPVVLTTPSNETGANVHPTPSITGSSSSKPINVSSETNPSVSTGPISGDATAPGPETFAQYDQYKNNTDPLFGELRMGTGIVAAVNNTATVNYKGWLTNGKEFDESYAKGRSFDFVIGQHRVILGWEKAILGMKVGGKRRFIIPPSDGYGDQVQNGIPAHSVLVFDVELLALR